MESVVATSRGLHTELKTHGVETASVAFVELKRQVLKAKRILSLVSISKRLFNKDSLDLHKNHDWSVSSVDVAELF